MKLIDKGLVKINKLYKVVHGQGYYVGTCTYIDPDAGDDRIGIALKLIMSNTFLAPGERIGWPYGVFNNKDFVIYEL